VWIVESLLRVWEYLTVVELVTGVSKIRKRPFKGGVGGARTPEGCTKDRIDYMSGLTESSTPARMNRR